MTIPNNSRQLRLGRQPLGIKQIEFKGDNPDDPRRDDLADELGANASGGVMLCGVADDGTIQHLSRNQLATLDRLLVEVCTDAIEPPLPIAVHHRELDGKAFLLVDVPPKM